MPTCFDLRRFVPGAKRAALLAGLVATAGCNEFLVAENPSAIEADALTDIRYANLITNGVIGEFQSAFGYLAYWNGVFSDELNNRAGFFEEPLIDLRDVTETNGTFSFFMYGNIHRTRWLADDGVSRLKTVLADSAGRDVRVARTLAYGGYAYLYLAEMMCNSPIDVSAPKTPDELTADALTRFNEAVTVATAAKAAAVPNSAIALAADSVRWFALVGAARASLYINNTAAAAGFAQTVVAEAPANWEFRVYYSANSARENNWFWNRLTSSTSGSMVNTPFQNITGDPRLPRVTTVGARLHVPLSPIGFSSWNNTVAGAAFTTDGFQRIASRLEAEYIVAEVAGPTAETGTFVNARRAVGLQAAVSLSGDSLMAELRDQRKRDLYLSNHRLGDLRRYKRFLNVDEFQTGHYPGSTSGQVYSTATCYPLPLAELTGNPNAGR